MKALVETRLRVYDWGENGPGEEHNNQEGLVQVEVLRVVQEEHREAGHAPLDYRLRGGQPPGHHAADPPRVEVKVQEPHAQNQPN